MPSGGDEQGQQQAPADRDAAPKLPEAEDVVAREPTAENDPIADLIAAELGRPTSVETPVDEPKAAPAPPAPPEAGPPQREVPTPIQARDEAEEQAREAPRAAAPLHAVRTQEATLPNPLQPRSEAQEHRSPPLASFGATASASAREADRFSVMPAAIPHPEPTQPEAELASSLEVAEGGDPMDEIESLIGEAVRVELEGPRPAQKPAPVVPPLGRATPRRADRADTGRHEPSVDSPEAAILAAAATTGVRVDHVDTPTAEGGKRAKKRAAVKPPRTSGLSSGARQFAGIGMSAVLLLAAGFGLYWVLGMGGNDDPANAPILSADAGPVKVEVSEMAETAAPTSVVFDELDGGSSAERDETLVSRDETEGASPTEVASIASPPPVAVDDQTESGLANRKVRTVTVRPDGTIVTGEATLAGSEALPVERPNVPEIAGADRATSDLLTAAVAESTASPLEALDLAADGPVALDPEVDPIAALVSNTGSATTTALTTPEPLDVVAGEEGPQVFDASIVAPIPQPRPANRAALLASTTSAPAPAATSGGTAPNPPASTPLVAVTQPADAAPPPPAASGAYVQLSSQRTENDARASLRSLESRMSGLLGGRSLDIRQVDLGQRGVWYRVVLPVTTFQDATQTCASIKANGLDCVPING